MLHKTIIIWPCYSMINWITGLDAWVRQPLKKCVFSQLNRNYNTIIIHFVRLFSSPIQFSVYQKGSFLTSSHRQWLVYDRRPHSSQAYASRCWKIRGLLSASAHEEKLSNSSLWKHRRLTRQAVTLAGSPPPLWKSSLGTNRSMWKDNCARV